MKYKIFKMVEPDVLSYIDDTWYNNIIRRRIALVEVQWKWDSQDSFDTEQEARDYVATHEDEFRSGNYAIILIF